MIIANRESNETLRKIGREKTERKGWLNVRGVCRLRITQTGLAVSFAVQPDVGQLSLRRPLWQVHCEWHAPAPSHIRTKLGAAGVGLATLCTDDAG